MSGTVLKKGLNDRQLRMIAIDGVIGAGLFVGPVLPMTTPEPTNRPAPITPPIAIIRNWRSLSPFFSTVPLIDAPLQLVRRSIQARRSAMSSRRVSCPGAVTRRSCSVRDVVIGSIQMLLMISIGGNSAGPIQRLPPLRIAHRSVSFVTLPPRHWRVKGVIPVGAGPVNWLFLLLIFAWWFSAGMWARRGRRRSPGSTVGSTAQRPEVLDAVAGRRTL